MIDNKGLGVIVYMLAFIAAVPIFIPRGIFVLFGGYAFSQMFSFGGKSRIPKSPRND